MEKPLIKRHPFPLLTVAWSPDGSRIASASQDGTVQVWQPDLANQPLASARPTA
jgi:WD40 repeat protein